MQVQRMVLQSFLERDWNPVRIALLPAAFLADCVLRTATQPIMLLKGWPMMLPDIMRYKHLRDRS